MDRNCIVEQFGLGPFSCGETEKVQCTLALAWLVGNQMGYSPSSEYVSQWIIAVKSKFCENPQHCHPFHFKSPQHQTPAFGDKFSASGFSAFIELTARPLNLSGYYGQQQQQRPGGLLVFGSLVAWGGSGLFRQSVPQTHQPPAEH